MASIRRGQQDLDDDSLRKRLLGYGEAVGPITDTTRASYQRRLSRLQNGTKSSARNRSSPSPADYQSLAGLSSDDSDYDSGGSLRSSRRKSAVPARKKATVTTPERTRRSLPAAPLTRPGLRSRAVNTSLYSDDFSETDNDVTPSHYQLQQTPLLTPRSTFNSGSLLVHKSDGETCLAVPPCIAWTRSTLCDRQIGVVLVCLAANVCAALEEMFRLPVKWCSRVDGGNLNISSHLDAYCDNPNAT